MPFLFDYQQEDVARLALKPFGYIGFDMGGGKTVTAACWAKLDETAHQPNEYCIIDNMLGDSKVFAHVFLQK